MSDQLEYEARLADYHKAVRNLWLKIIPALLCVSVVISFGVFWLLIHFSGVVPLDTPDWRLVAAVSSVALLILPVKLHYPERPSPESVKLDKLLNAIGRQLQESKHG